MSGVCSSWAGGWEARAGRGRQCRPACLRQSSGCFARQTTSPRPCPSSSAALQAVQRLDTLAASSPGTEAAAAAGAALLRRLQDDSPAVVQAVLSAASLLQLPSGPLLEGLASCFDRALSQVRGTGGAATRQLEQRDEWQRSWLLLFFENTACRHDVSPCCLPAPAPPTPSRATLPPPPTRPATAARRRRRALNPAASPARF